MITEEQIENIVNTIKKVARPKAIYLFGSYAAGLAHDNSDLDIAVIKNAVQDKHEQLFEIRRALFSYSF